MSVLVALLDLGDNIPAERREWSNYVRNYADSSKSFRPTHYEIKAHGDGV